MDMVNKYPEIKRSKEIKEILSITIIIKLLDNQFGRQ